MSDTENELFEGVAETEDVEIVEEPPVKEKKARKPRKPRKKKEPEPEPEPEPIEEEPEPEPEPIEEEPEPEPEPEPVKPAKKKRVLTEEQKERLRENLKRGRLTSLANRKKKAQLRKIEKEKQTAEDDAKIFEALKKKLKPSELEDENSKLKAELAELRASMSKKNESPKPEPTPEKTEKKPEPPKPAPPAKKKMSARDRKKMLAGL